MVVTSIMDKTSMETAGQGQRLEWENPLPALIFYTNKELSVKIKKLTKF